MHSGFYTIASGMLTRQRELDTIGNNLSNLQTPGYRSDRIVTSAFELGLLQQQEGGTERILSDGGSPVTIVGDSVTVMTGGDFQSTGRTLDIAIGGDGFFNVQGQDGTTYLTRNGQFTVDDQGYLTLAGMGRVLGQGGPLMVGSDQVSVDAAGNVYNAAGALVGTLSITRQADNTVLEKMDNGAFTAPQGAVNAQGYTIYQGVLERSNVDMNQELTSFISAQRAFQTCSSALQIIDDLDQKAASKIAAIQ